MSTITSLHNPRIRQVIALHDGRERRATGLYLVEGKRELERLAHAARSSSWIEGACELYAARSAYEKSGPWLAQFYSELEPCVLPDSLFAKISLRQSPDGFLAVARQRPCSWQQLDLQGVVRLIVAERVEKPGNLGALLRLADAVGAKALVLCQQQVEIWNPNVIRASMGSFFHVPTVEFQTLDFIEEAKKQKIELVAATPHSSLLYSDRLYGPRVALIVGAEDRGLSDYWQGAQGVRLPMLGMADSINVSNAAAVCLYEILRQQIAQGWVDGAS